MSSSSSSLHSGSYCAIPELPLIPCKNCRQDVIELVSKKPESKWRKFYRCNCGGGFFCWQANYALNLFREGFVTDSDQVTNLVMVALDDHSKAVESLTTSIRDTKQKLVDLEAFMKQEHEVMKQELDKLKAAMFENEENKKSTASALQLDLPKLKGSTTVKPRTLAMYSLGFLLLAILIGWFLMGHMNGEKAFRGLVNGEEALRRVMLSP